MLKGTGRRLSWLTPAVDCQLPDGSRFHAIAPPLSRSGICLSIRKFKKSLRDLESLCAIGALDESIMAFLKEKVHEGGNIVVSGGTSTGKTTFLNALASEIPRCQRVITVEDAAELQLNHPHVVSLEARPANGEGLGEVSIRELVRNALRMRPDRIVVGECRGGEALDMLQAMNTGHDGSLTTVHANSGLGALLRLETLCLYANSGLPSAGLRQQIGTAIHYVVQLKRTEGVRRLVEIIAVEAGDLSAQGGYRTRTIVQYDKKIGGWLWT